MAEKATTKVAQNLQKKPPVVVVMGHVDHGKTTLLDSLRSSRVAEKEHGAITQHIGAYQLTLPNKEKITFIDTPGHEAFSAMRARGANVADIAILVVAADDSVKPQTQEAIKHIKQAGIPMIVAVNKIDLPSANAEKVKQDLSQSEVYVEGYGGDIPIQEISAKIGTGMADLLEVIGLVAEIEELTADPNAPISAAVIESRIDKGRGPVATLIVQQGTMKQGQDYYVEGKKFKVRALISDTGAQLKDAGPGTPIEVLGLMEVPKVGAIIESAEQDVIEEVKVDGRPALATYFRKKADELPVIVKADASGSLEAIVMELQKIADKNESTRLKILSAQTGDITDSDISLAKTTTALILGFNVKATPQARTMAQVESIPFKIYTLIYELLEDVQALLEVGFTLAEEKPKGEAEVVQLFPTPVKVIVGVKVTHGRLRLGESVKIVRAGESLGSGKIRTMRHIKDDVKEISKNMEAGVVIDTDIEIQPQDMLQYSP